MIISILIQVYLLQRMFNLECFGKTIIPNLQDLTGRDFITYYSDWMKKPDSSPVVDFGHICFPYSFEYLLYFQKTLS